MVLKIDRPSGTAVAVAAWKSTLSATAKMPWVFVSAVAASALFLLLQGYIIGHVPVFAQRAILLRTPGATNSSALFIRFAFNLPLFCVRALFAAPVAVAIHRYILLGEKTPGVISLRPSYTRHFIAWLIGVQVLVSGAVLVAPPRGRASLILLAAVLLALVGSLWVAMLFPAVAVDERTDGIASRLKTALQRTSGNFWLIFRSLFLTFLPLFVVSIVFAIWSLRYFRVGNLRSGLSMAESFAFAPLQILSIGLGAAVASWIFAWASHKSDGQIT